MLIAGSAMSKTSAWAKNSERPCTTLAVKLYEVETDKADVALIDEIREDFAADRFQLSRHATDRTVVRHIEVREVREAVAAGEVIEDYPDDKYGPSCLIFGTTLAGRPLHVQCGYPSGAPVRIVTLYEPTPEHWIDLRRRRLG